jgi:hypothetical protein
MSEALYVAARDVLLDALEALGEQREALILAGAQAIYVHTGDADLAVAVFTTDGDLVVNPSLLRSAPLLSEAMERARFRPGDQPGSWLRDRIVEGKVTEIPSIYSCRGRWLVAVGAPRDSVTTATARAGECAGSKGH